MKADEIRAQRAEFCERLRALISEYTLAVGSSSMVVLDDDRAGGYDDDHSTEDREHFSTPHHLAAVVVAMEWAPMDPSTDYGSVQVTIDPPGQATLHSRGVVRHVAQAWGVA